MIIKIKKIKIDIKSKTKERKSILKIFFSFWYRNPEIMDIILRRFSSQLTAIIPARDKPFISRQSSTRSPSEVHPMTTKINPFATNPSLCTPSQFDPISCSSVSLSHHDLLTESLLTACADANTKQKILDIMKRSRATLNADLKRNEQLSFEHCNAIVEKLIPSFTRSLKTEPKKSFLSVWKSFKDSYYSQAQGPGQFYFCG